MSSIVLSIITPTLNSCLTIARYFNSLPPELSKFFEIVIVDNHSSDNTIEIISRYKNKFSIKLYQKGDYGIYDAMNIGYTISSGNFLLFLNSDDWIERDNFYFLIELLRESNENLIIFHQKRWINQSKFTIDKPILSKVMKSTIPHQCFIFSRNLFDHFGPYDTKLRICADYDLLINIFLSEEQPKYVNVVLTNFSSTGYSSKIINITLYYKEVLLIWNRYKVNTYSKTIMFSLKTIGLYFYKLSLLWAGRGSNPEPTD